MQLFHAVVSFFLYSNEDSANVYISQPNLVVFDYVVRQHKEGHLKVKQRRILKREHQLERITWDVSIWIRLCTNSFRQILIQFIMRTAKKINIKLSFAIIGVKYTIQTAISMNFYQLYTIKNKGYYTENATYTCYSTYARQWIHMEKTPFIKWNVRRRCNMIIIYKSTFTIEFGSHFDHSRCWCTNHHSITTSWNKKQQNLNWLLVEIRKWDFLY